MIHVEALGQPLWGALQSTIDIPEGTSEGQVQLAITANPTPGAHTLQAKMRALSKTVQLQIT